MEVVETVNVENSDGEVKVTAQIEHFSDYHFWLTRSSFYFLPTNLGSQLVDTEETAPLMANIIIPSEYIASGGGLPQAIIKSITVTQIDVSSTGPMAITSNKSMSRTETFTANFAGPVTNIRYLCTEEGSTTISITTRGQVIHDTEGSAIISKTSNYETPQFNKEVHR